MRIAIVRILFVQSLLLSSLFSFLNGQIGCPKVIRIQVDACGFTPEQERRSEFFQFITGEAYNLNTSSVSINVGSVSMSGFKSLSAIALAALNAKVGQCGSGPIFLDPYAIPNSGIIPFGSIVLAFIDQNPFIDGITSLKSLCGKAPIYVICGNSQNLSAMFLDGGCISNCSRTIIIKFGSCSKSITYDASVIDPESGSYFLIDNNDQVKYMTSDGCFPEFNECEKPKFIIGNQSPLSCKEFGYELPEISDIYTGNAMYFKGPGRSGEAIPIGKIIYDSITLYASDVNSCNPTGTQIEKTFRVNITNGPAIDDIFNRPELVCGYYVLPEITGKNLTGNQRYWTQNYKQGIPLDKGDTIRSDITLFVYDEDVLSGCSDSAELTIKFVAAPNINNPKDTIVPCGVSFQLPPFNGINLSGNTAYYTGSKKTSPAIPPSSFITTGGIYYAFDELGQCFDEDTFNISLISNIIIPKDIIYPDTFCTEYTLPNINGLKVNYNTRLDGLGLSFMPNDTIITSYKLYIKASNLGCSVTDSVMYTRQWVFINPIFIDQPCKPILDTLPRIQGNFLTNQVAYYSERGAKANVIFPGILYMPSKEVSYIRVKYCMLTIVYNTGPVNVLAKYR